MSSRPPGARPTGVGSVRFALLRRIRQWNRRDHYQADTLTVDQKTLSACLCQVFRRSSMLSFSALSNSTSSGEAIAWPESCECYRDDTGQFDFLLLVVCVRSGSLRAFRREKRTQVDGLALDRVELCLGQVKYSRVLSDLVVLTSRFRTKRAVKRSAPPPHGKFVPQLLLWELKRRPASSEGGAVKCMNAGRGRTHAVSSGRR